MIESAAGVEREHENAAKSRRDLDEALRKATNDENRKQKVLEKANLDSTEWSCSMGGGTQSTSPADHINTTKPLTLKSMQSTI